MMLAVARECAFLGSPIEFMDPETNIHYGCLKLKQLMHKYGENYIYVAAAYNGGSVIKLPSGMLKNQAYVDKFALELRRMNSKLV